MKYFFMRPVICLVLLIFLGLNFFVSTCSQTKNYQEVINLNIVQKNKLPFGLFLGINGFEWDFLGDKRIRVDSSLVEIMQSFGGFRHYMEWERIETKRGVYNFNPTLSGGFNYDLVYKTCKDNGIEIVACLKGCPPWLLDTYPKDLRDNENVPAPYSSDLSNPASYIDQAKAAFQFAARYGHNKYIDPLLVYNRYQDNDGIYVKSLTGLGYINYIECNNEVDRSWKGPNAHQSPEEYAANLSAFYDGDMGKLGKNVGVKNADSSMKVVMAGLATPDVNYVIKMIEWCKRHRGFKKDGSVNLCFDIINYHFYNNDATEGFDNRTRGKAPELSLAGKYADDFVDMSKRYANNMDVWITESGYDVHPGSPQRAIAIGKTSALITQANWILRSTFLYSRHGLKSAYYYMLDDATPNHPGPYSTSGFVSNFKKRPVIDYFIQSKKILTDYKYDRTIYNNPIVDVYINLTKKIYIIYIPDEINKKATYNLSLRGKVSAQIYHLLVGTNDPKKETAKVKNGKLELLVTETPLFVEID